MDEMTWARSWRDGQRVGKKPARPGQVVRVGDVIPVVPAGDGSPGVYSLSQVPDVDGAIIALDPHTGRILALVGGYSFEGSEFNRATQARRQPGSAFKPFVYGAALENGFTPSSLVLDAPFVIDQGPGRAKWKPANYTKMVLRTQYPASGYREVEEPDDGSLGAVHRHGEGRRLRQAVRDRRRDAGAVVYGVGSW